MRYLGNKTRLLEEIEQFIKENSIEGETFFDLFSGTGAVAEYFQKSYKVSSNDYMKFSYFIQSSKLLNNSIPNFTKLNNNLQQNVFDFLNNMIIDEKIDESWFVSKNYSDNTSQRKYFSEENGKIIDKTRKLIEEWYSSRLISDNERYYLLHSLLEAVAKVSNTTGTYGAYLKELDNRAKKRIQFVGPEIISGKSNTTYNKDAEDLITEIKGDILYIDPPYTNFNYSRGYHLLETIAKYDFPEIKGITGVRLENERTSNFSKKKNALISFENIIRKANFNNIVISYSNHGLIPEEELMSMLEKYSIGKPIIKYINYREYKTINSPNKNMLKEFLIYIKKDNKIIKSPLNYEGNKFKIIRQIINSLPAKINNFHDVFGGSGTVSMNILGSNKIYLNDINTNTISILKYLLKYNENLIIEDIKRNIQENNLSKGNKDNFYLYRDNIVNNEKTPLNLLTLSYFSFQNMLRQNSSGDINITSGLSSFNENSIKNIKDLKQRQKKMSIKLTNSSFEKYINNSLKNANSEDLYYLDPPYLITTASYNDGKRGFEGWDAHSEALLLEKILEIHASGSKFILSNVIVHKEKKNNLLEDFVKTHDFKIKQLEDKGRKEVLITNI